VHEVRNSDWLVSRQHGNEEQMIQRLYFYAVAFVSFAASITALNRLLAGLDDVWFAQMGKLVVGGDSYGREVLAASAGVLIVAVPIYLLHWHLIQRRLEQPGERTSGLRKLFLYAVSAVAIGFALYSANSLAGGLLALVLGEPLAESEIWPDGWFHLALMVVIGWMLEKYYHRILVSDGDYGRETELAGVARKLFQVVAGLVGLALILSAGSDILETVWRLATQQRNVLSAGIWWRGPLADGAALLLVGLSLLVFNWRRWQTIIVANADETRSAFRRVYLYAGVVAGAVATLVPAANLLREGLLLLLGSGAADRLELVDKLATPFGLMPVGVAVWIWHRRVLRAESAQYGESSEGVTVRRVYYYVVAATGLALVWFGAAETTSAMLDWALGAGSKARGPGIWVEPLATGLSLLAVGVPVWAMHWRTVQGFARRQDDAGRAERVSRPRRAYLYAAALAGALLILYYFARVVYRLLLSLLGDPYAGLLSVETADEIARAAISAVLWTVHVLAIRTDNRMDATQPAAALDAERERGRLSRRIEQLEGELAQARDALTRLEEEDIGRGE
jgi:hypothetical protein